MVLRSVRLKQPMCHVDAQTRCQHFEIKTVHPLSFKPRLLIKNNDHNNLLHHTYVELIQKMLLAQ